MKILVIEDEEKTRNFLGRGLTECGYQVQLVDNGESGLFQAQYENYDLVILDVMLPGIDGWSVISRLRGAGNNTPILCLSAQNGVYDRVKGLELGADGYLPKPVTFSELLARTRALLRRGIGAKRECILRIEDLEIDFSQSWVIRAGKRLDLTPKEYQLLVLFARRQGEIISRVTICEEVWKMDFNDQTNIVDVQVNRLRAKVDAGFEKKLIRTVRGAGYVLGRSE